VPVAKIEGASNLQLTGITGTMKDLLAIGIGGWIGTAIVVGYFYTRNVEFDVKTVAIACLAPVGVSLTFDIMYQLLRLNAYVINAMFQHDVVMFSITLLSFAFIAHIIYKSKYGVQFLDTRETLIEEGGQEGEGDEEEEGGEEGEEEGESVESESIEGESVDGESTERDSVESEEKKSVKEVDTREETSDVVEVSASDIVTELPSI
jgi:hypothetical protein